MSTHNLRTATLPANSEDSLRALARDGLFTFVLACVVFGPITGLQLSPGFDFVANWQRPFWLATVVTLGRLFFLSILRTPWGKERLRKAAAARSAGCSSPAGPPSWPLRCRWCLHKTAM